MTLEPAAPESGYLTTKEVAALIGGTTAQHIRQLISAGRLPAINIAKGFDRPRYRVPVAAVQQFLREALVMPRPTSEIAPSEVA